MTKSKTQVGSPMNFRGMVYKPINEQGVVYLFGLIAEDMNIRVESIQQGYPDCTGLRFVGNGRWERVRIEFEYRSSNFDHDPAGCDLVICWEDDLTQKEKEEMGLIENNVEIIELKSTINSPDIPDKELKDPEQKSKQEFTLSDHLKEVNASENIKHLFEKLNKEIKKIDSKIWDKYSKTAITYYSPDKVFLYINLRKNSIDITPFTDSQNLSGIENTKNHENWGFVKISNEEDLVKIVPSLARSYEIIKQAEKEGKKTGWYALTPEKTKEHDE